MIWPFKKREPEVPFAEFVKTLDPAPCGEQELHYQWKLGSNMPCPACQAIKTAKRKDAELDALADKIAARLRADGLDACATPSRALPHPGSPEASAMMDSLMAEYQWPSNTKNAARAGWEAANRWLTTGGVTVGAEHTKREHTPMDGGRAE
jgi:hypothetical protein